MNGADVKNKVTLKNNKTVKKRQEIDYSKSRIKWKNPKIDRRPNRQNVQERQTDHKMW